MHPKGREGRPLAVSYNSYYNHRCRCEDCRTWNADRQRAKRARRQARLTGQPPVPEVPVEALEALGIQVVKDPLTALDDAIKALEEERSPAPGR